MTKVKLTNLDKVLFAKTGTTKADVINYYEQVAMSMIPHIKNRPITRKRWPNGIKDDGSGMVFFQKNLDAGTPDWVEKAAIQHKDHTNNYPLANTVDTLIWLAQLAALELHTPQWRFNDNFEKQNPDRLVFDLDPGVGTGLKECVEVAKIIKTILDDMGLISVPVTSGSKGIHVYAGLDGSYSSKDASAVAHELARALESEHPKKIISKMRKADREGKVFIDWSQNNENKTTIAPYSLRGKADPTVAAPRSWEELFEPELKQLNKDEVLGLLKVRGDPLAALLRSEDALQEYRAKRDPLKTSEPFPNRSVQPKKEEANTPRFVIQRHEARRLHYDFRLEHEGVLKSWALPKGVPATSTVNHLAIQTEDHPLEYQYFEGTIPKGEYGGGKVLIWDSGEIKIEKWENKKIMVVLFGRKDGGLGGQPKRLTLLQTNKNASNGDSEWLIHLNQNQDPTPVSQHLPSPMLLTLSSAEEISTLSSKEWAFETKWDGYRAVVGIHNEEVTIMSRNRLNINHKFPRLTAIKDEVELDSVIFDGEIVALAETSGGQQIPDFGLLREEGANLRYYVFDVLEVNGISTDALSYSDRRKILTEIPLKNKRLLKIPPPIKAKTGKEAISICAETGFEGIIAKRLKSAYYPGTRTRNWLKFPFKKTAEVVVVAWKHSETEPQGFASLLLATPQNGALQYVGKVGTGFSLQEKQELRKLFNRCKTNEPIVDVPVSERQSVTWLKPQIIGEVTYRELTKGGKLRHSSWRGLRTDKSIDTISKLK